MNFPVPVCYLLDHACPSIQYRIRKEILSEDIHSSRMLALQEMILQEKAVMEVLVCSKENGWLGGCFHDGNTKEPESGIRFLYEKGVEPDHPVIQGALKAMLTKGENFDDGALIRVGKQLDAAHLGGSKMILACVFAYANREDEPFVKEQIKEAVSAFQYVSSIHNLEEVCTKYKGKLVFAKNSVKWPSIYHLRLLALTKSWRNDVNTSVVTSALRRLVELSPIPEIKLFVKGQLISPAHAYMNDFKVDLKQLKDKDFMMWFHRFEMISRMGILSSVPLLQNQLNDFKEMIKDYQGFFTKNLSHFYFTKWTNYTGLALESDWKGSEHKMFDLTFRSLLILKYSGEL